MCGIASLTSNLLCTNPSNTTAPKPISYRDNSSSGSGHGLPKIFLTYYAQYYAHVHVETVLLEYIHTILCSQQFYSGNFLIMIAPPLKQAKSVIVNFLKLFFSK